MKNATTLLSDSDTQRIVEAIAAAERHTEAEFVCAVATESGRYDRAESIVGLFFALLALSLAYALQHQLGGGAWNHAEWGDAVATGLHVGYASLAVVVGFIAGSVLASYCHPVRRMVTSDAEMTAESERAASYVFSDAAVRLTTDRTGLLIYVSLFEHRVVVLADEKSKESLGEERIAAWRDVAVEALREGACAEAMINVVNSAAETLRESLPADRDTDADQLANHVLTFHPRP